MSKHIVIVEDDEDQRENYQVALEQRGYKVTSYSSKETAEKGLESFKPDMVVSDIIMQNNVDAGFQLCSFVLARHPQVPILFLTERVAELDKIIGLRMGAWDYQPKPVSLDFLAEKVATLLRLSELREAPQTVEQKIYQVGHLMLLEDSRVAKWKEQEIEGLTLTEFRMLETLTRRPGNVISYDVLAKTTHQHYVSNNTISTHIRNIKRKIKRLDNYFDAIQSEYGLGYRWQV